MPKVGTTLAALALAAALAVAAALPQGGRAALPSLERRPIALPTRLLFDLGVVDFDADGDLDVFTLNHNDPQALLVNQGEGRFENRLSSLGLDQSRGFPGFPAPLQPDTSQSGVYLFRQLGGSLGDDVAEGSLAVVVEADPGDEVSGEVEFALPVAVRRADGAEVSTGVETGRQPIRHVVRFRAEGGARMLLEPEQMAAPIDVGIEAGYPLSSIFVGPLRISPRAHRFTLYVRDRHGMAWGDYDRDGVMDVFIIRGGLKGHLEDLGATGLITDELMLGGSPAFHDVTATSGLVKGACRGRGAEPVDFDRDGRLELLWSCHGSKPSLFRQNRMGRFTDRSHRLARAGVGGEQFEALDVNGDDDDELIAVGQHKLRVFRVSRKRRWVRREGVRTLGGAPPRALAVADYDNDGDPDIFAPSPTGDTLLVNRAGRLRARSPGSLGLPRGGSVGAAWVDYDNDGRLDLYTVPKGLFRRVGPRRFRATHLAATDKRTADALTSWFDFDANGTRDLLLASAHPEWRASLYENAATENHWLEVELLPEHGSPPAVGARVRVRTRGRTQTQWVGQNDGSRHSKGHYRLYFGLGGAQRARSLQVIWPDGSKRRLKRVPADQLLHVSFDRPQPHP